MPLERTLSPDKNYVFLTDDEKQEDDIARTYAARVLDERFTHLITVNFARNVKFLPQTLAEKRLRAPQVLSPPKLTTYFLSQFAIEIQSICLNLSKNRVKKLTEPMPLVSVTEDFKKKTSIPEPRHFNIAVSMPLLDSVMSQMRVKAAAKKIAQRVFKTKTTNCYIERLENLYDPELRVRYDIKNCFKTNTHETIISEEDFCRKTK